MSLSAAWWPGVAASLAVASLAPMASVAKKYTVMIVLTHGDDVASITPLAAKYAAEGHTVHHAIFPGLQGAIGEEPDSKGREELRCASRALGMAETFVTRGPEGQGHNTTAAIAARMVELIDETKPDVIITWGPDGLTGHPRHILVGNVVTRVFQQQSRLAHRPRKLYYIAYPEDRFPETRAPFGGIFPTVPLGTVSDRFITTRVDARKYLTQSRLATACYTTPDLAPRAARNERTFEQEWNHRTATTLDGIVFLRLALPAGRLDETDIFTGL